MQKPPFLRRRLGNRLRILRENAGLNLDEASAKLDKSRTALHRTETGENKPDVHLIRSMMDLYDCYVDGLVDQARQANQRQWFHQYGSADLGYVDVETAAVLVREFCTLNLPGLLQTEPYARAVLASSPLPRTPKALDDQVAVRMIRQWRLTDSDDPLDLVAVVDEAALRRQVGDADVMHGQLERLIKTAALPTVTLQILPQRGGAHSVPDSGFTLLSFPEDFNPELLYVEHVAGALHIEETEAVRTATMVFDRLRGDALDPTESVALIKQVRAELDDR